MGTFEWDILNPDRIINLEIKMSGEQAIFNLQIKKKSGLSLNPDIHHSKVFSSDYIRMKDTRSDEKYSINTVGKL